MDRHSTPTRSDLEWMLRDEKAEPKALPLSLLEDITNGFSDEQEIGRGGYSVVYKGLLDNGAAVAVKRLSKTHLYEKEFHREVECLIKVNHRNVIRFIGYCADSQGIAANYNGNFVMADVQQRLLCFEYLPHGTLDKYINDASCGIDWRKRYKIINGICKGLNYLHQNRILHLDLKPLNILLDDNMLPKITDFGLSRCFAEKQTRAITANIGGTFGYLAPEFSNGEITYRFDLYSLGVIIIEILTGKKGYHKVDDVVKSWSNRLEKSQHGILLEQVRVCAEIGIECIDSNPAKRPDTQRIIDRLNETESMDGYIEAAAITSWQAENAPNELHHNTHKMSGEASYESSSVPWSSNLFLDQMQPAQISEVVFPALKKIGSILGDEDTRVTIANLSKKATNLKKLPGQAERLGKQLSMLGNFIRQIDIVHHKDGIVKSWIGEVRNLAYRVEDIMDKCSSHVIKLKREGFLKKFNQTHYVKVFTEIMDEMSVVDKEIQQVIQKKGHWLLPSEEIFPEFVQGEYLVGIEDNRILLTGWLYSEEQESTVITVSGMGGLGKTTLVTNVYEREKINFHAHAWLAVSQICTVDALLRKLICKIGYIRGIDTIDKMDVHDLKKEIQQSLENIKYLIVLDDVWEQDVYLQIHDALQNLQGSRIIITTRKYHVAEISHSNRRLEVQPLSKSDAFEIFCRRAFYNIKGQMCPKELATVATSIVDRCHGMPLAIATIGGMLSSRRRLDIWRQTYSQLCEVSTNDHVRDILNLSYHDLSGDLRNCLVYCSLFPGNYSMSCDSLVRLWVAEGFALSKEENTPEVVAEGILIELIRRNMLEIVENDELGGVNTCKMHDIVRELASSVAKEERFASADDYDSMIQMGKDVRRLSSCGWKNDTPLKVKLPHLRTVLFLEAISASPGMLSSILSESNYLAVLELQDSEVTELPTSIGSLFNLRYIGLRRTKVRSLPDCIENLSNLHTLDIKQTKIEKLPRGVVKIRKLRHLLADRYADEKQTEFRYFLGVQAPKDLSNLEELQTLETVESSYDLGEQLKKLLQLRTVWIDNITAPDSANLFATLSSMPLLSSLLLSARDENEALCFEALQPRSTDLYKLIIRGNWAKGTLNCPIFLNHGTHLKYLALSWCHLGEDPLGMLAPHMPNLTYLRLNNMRSAKTLVLSADSFPNLKVLVLKHMHDVSQINIIDGALPCIEGLYIVSLSKLDMIPQGIESLHSLKKLWMLNLHKNFRSQWVTNGMRQKILHVPEVRV